MRINVSIISEEVVSPKNPAAIEFAHKRLIEMCAEWNEKIAELKRQIEALDT